MADTSSPEKRAAYLAYLKDYQAKNKDKLREKARAYYLKNKEKIKARSKAWAEANPDRVKELARKNYQKRKQTDPEGLKQRNRAWYEANKAEQMARGRAARLARQGWTVEAYEKAVVDQAGKCAICSKEDKLHADHNHATGKARALLCGNCNRGLGLFNESEEVLRQAIAYLTRFRED